ncbi:hypothetical protein LZ32DRAFT_186672 [Colletotrichum eremochloae]|nr:hypothetical protein LZ32DRAFT_186672 [Colletotrichum eremochloae]
MCLSLKLQDNDGPYMCLAMRKTPELHVAVLIESACACERTLNTMSAMHLRPEGRVDASCGWGNPSSNQTGLLLRLMSRRCMHDAEAEIAAQTPLPPPDESRKRSLGLAGKEKEGRATSAPTVGCYEWQPILSSSISAHLARHGRLSTPKVRTLSKEDVVDPLTHRLAWEFALPHSLPIYRKGTFLNKAQRKD